VEIGGLALLSASEMDPSAIVFQAIREIEVVLPASNIPDRTLQRMACDLSRDGLERELFFNLLEGCVGTMCAPGDQGKFSNDRREQLELNVLRRRQRADVSGVARQAAICAGQLANGQFAE